MTESAQSSLRISTAVVQELLANARAMFSSGKTVNSGILKEAFPGHSTRDYAEAIKQFHAERELSVSCAQSAPDQIQQLASHLSGIAWSTAKSKYDAELREKEKLHKLALEECRAAREKIQAEFAELKTVCEERGLKIKQLQSDIAELQSECSRLSKTNREQLLNQAKNEQEIIDQSNAIKMLSELLERFKGSASQEVKASSQDEMKESSK